MPGHRRVLLTCIVILLTCIPLFGQIKHAVAIVKPVLSGQQREMYTAMASYFESRGLDKWANYFSGMLEAKGFGSGFLVTREDGRRFVVTNRHVVTGALFVNLTFNLEEGGIVEINDCPVIYRDDDVDFAAIGLQGTEVNGLPDLQIATTLPKEGADVWTAGYPGLSGKPSWQLARGNITNKRFFDEELGFKESAIYVQHSAPIDPGNSGGPLLYGDVLNPETMRVIGVNTLQAGGRQNTNFAVSLELLKACISRVPRNGGIPSGEESLNEVENKARNLVSVLRGDKFNPLYANRFIAYDYAARQGWDVFSSTVYSLPAKEKDTWLERFFQSQHIETLRQYLFWKLWNSLHVKDYQSDLIFDSVEMRNHGELRYIRAMLKSGNNEYPIDWAYQAGSWQIVGIDLPQIALSSIAAPEKPKPETKKKEAVPASVSDKLAVPDGLMIVSGSAALPSLAGWVPGLEWGAGGQLALGPVLGVSGALLLWVDTARQNLASFDSTNTVKTIFGFELAAKFGYKIPMAEGGWYPYLGAVTRLGFPLSTGYNPYQERVFFDFGFGVGSTVQITLNFSIGIEGMVLFATDTVTPRLSAFPIRMYLVF